MWSMVTLSTLYQFPRHLDHFCALTTEHMEFFLLALWQTNCIADTLKDIHYCHSTVRDLLSAPSNCITNDHKGIFRRSGQDLLGWCLVLSDIYLWHLTNPLTLEFHFRPEICNMCTTRMSILLMWVTLLWTKMAKKCRNHLGTRVIYHKNVNIYTTLPEEL